MNIGLRAGLLAAALALAPAAASADPLDMVKLKSMLENMGFTPKVISDPGQAMKVEIATKAGEYDIPVAIEMSGSTKYIWCTAFFGSSKLTGDDALKALRRNYDTQPTVMWVNSKGGLTMGIAIDNREVTPAVMKFVLDKLDADVAGSSDIWDKK